MYKKRIDGAYQDVTYGHTYMHVWVGGLVLHVGSTPSTILCFFLYTIRYLVPSQSLSLYIYMYHFNFLGLLWLYAQVHGAPLLYAQVRFASVS